MDGSPRAAPMPDGGGVAADPAIVVTGIGLVTGLGVGVAANVPRLLGAEVAVGEFDLFPSTRHRTRLAAQAPVADRGFGRGPTRADELALLAAREAFEQAGAGVRRLGVCFGSSNGGLLESERWYAALRERGRAPACHQLARQPVDAPGQAVARALGARGPVWTLSTACVSASMAIATAADWLRDGDADVVVAGGVDSLCQVTYAGFNSLRAVDAQASRPFRVDRAGLSLGEGAGVLVLERERDARDRGARPLARLLGFGQSCDAHHMSAPAPDGAGAARAIRAALAMAGVAPERIAFVDAHGTGTPHNDAAEAHALASVFGARAATLPVTSTKALVGHVLGGSGGVEAVATVLALRHRRVHATPGGGAVDPQVPVALVRDAIAVPVDAVGLSTNLAFGGANTALLFGVVTDA